MIFVYIIVTLVISVVLISIFRKNNVISLLDLRKKYEQESSKYMELNGLKCHYTDEGTGPVVVLVHGLGDSFMIFKQFMPFITKNNRVIRMDLPGFGLTDIPKDFGKEGEPIDYYITFVKSFVDQLGLDKFHLIGNSLGGLVSWEFAVHHQERLNSLCLIASAGYEMDAVKKNITKGILHLLPKFLLKNGMPMEIARKNVSMVVNRRENRTDSFIQNHYDMTNREGVLEYLLHLVSYKDLPVTDDLKKLNIPTLISWGDKDHLVPSHHVDLFHKDIQNSEKMVYLKCGHYPQVEYASKFYEDWSLFVSRLK